MASVIDIPVYDMAGSKLGAEQIDASLLGGTVRAPLLKQAIVAHEAACRLGTAASKSRAMVQGSSRKLFRQKGTGNARMGNARTPVRRGGGHAFAKQPRDFSVRFPRKMRRLARDSALLAKMKSGNALIIDAIRFDQPKTKAFAGMLAAVGATGSCLVTLADRNETVWRSGRNLPGIDIRT
ncbi:MAG: 50S ribosomal protein L4, partial [Phycisphaerae bacterium]